MKPSFVKIAALFAAIVSVTHAQLYIATGASTGVVAYFNFTLNPTTNQLSVTIDNTHASAGGVTGTVTSFGFDVPDSLIASATLISAPTGWALSRPYDLNAGGNAFMQDLGAMTGSNPNGGSPQDGIAFGETASFTFQFADFASASGFLGEDGISARWQVVNAGGGSDAGFGNPGPTPGPELGAVPEPSTYGLIGAGLLFAAITVRRLRAKWQNI
jgi:hypothetical protein